jgi:hypothetical protein
MTGGRGHDAPLAAIKDHLRKIVAAFGRRFG